MPERFFLDRIQRQGGALTVIEGQKGPTFIFSGAAESRFPLLVYDSDEDRAGIESPGHFPACNMQLPWGITYL